MPCERCNSFHCFPELPKSWTLVVAGNNAPSSSVTPETSNVPSIIIPAAVHISLGVPLYWRSPPPPDKIRN